MLVRDLLEGDPWAQLKELSADGPPQAEALLPLSSQGCPADWGGALWGRDPPPAMQCRCRPSIQRWAAEATQV